MAGTEAFETGRVTDADLPAPDVSIVVTLFNEVASVEELYRRTVAALDPGPRTFELIFIDDGSTDGTFAALERLHGGDPRVRAVRFKRNFGQHPAMHAGLSRARGDVVVTMDGDLQNQPEDIPRLVEAVEAGNDVASGRRRARKDPVGRSLPSHVINGMLRRFTGVAISDFGCAFNAYRRDAVEPMLGSIGKQKFTKALVLSGGASVIEVDVAHAPRHGPSRYSPLRLTRLALHVLAGYWPQPIQWIGVLLGAVSTLLALALDIGSYQNFLLLIGSVFVPLLGVLAVDWFVVSRQRWDLSESAPVRWSMIVPWALGFIAYQLINPGYVDWWVRGWAHVRAWLHFTPTDWMSASLLSFLVAAAATLLTGVLARARVSAE
jgi:undecaprenyl-phosphate 4-deoxy-4-formamido-L-arabinose transferase